MFFLRAFEVARTFPVGHNLVKLLLFGVEEMQIMFDHILPKSLPGPVAFFKFPDGFIEGLRHLGQVTGPISISGKKRWGFNLFIDSVQSGSQSGGEGQVDVGVCAGGTAFYP